MLSEVASRSAIEPYFIAEAGVNHNGEIDIAKDLIDVAAEAGADAVKFQTFSAERLVSENASTAAYQEEKTGIESQQEMLRQYELDRDDHETLIEYCREQNITFLSTPFDCESVDLLVDLGVSAIKIGSGELDNHPLLRHAADYGLPMIVSTGMGTMEEVHAAYDVIRDTNTETDVVFLHCTSTYPCDVEDVHLRTMKTMSNELPVPVGYSDHTLLPEMPAMAVAAGARVVEKHFTLDSSLPGPDHEASLEPNQLKKAVTLVETVSDTLGTPEKEPTEAEKENMTTVRKSLHAAVKIPEGTTIEEKHLDILRPAEGISPREYNRVLGQQTVNDIGRGEAITTTDVAFGEEGRDT